MTDPKNPEAQNEELDLEQLEEAAGGLGTTAGPGGTSFPKTNVAGSASPGGDYFRQGRQLTDCALKNGGEAGEGAPAFHLPMRLAVVLSRLPVLVPTGNDSR